MKLDMKRLKDERPEVVAEYSAAAKRDGGLRVSKKKEA